MKINCKRKYEIQLPTNFYGCFSLNAENYMFHSKESIFMNEKRENKELKHFLNALTICFLLFLKTFFPFEEKEKLATDQHPQHLAHLKSDLKICFSFEGTREKCNEKVKFHSVFFDINGSFVSITTDWIVSRKVFFFFGFWKSFSSFI